MADNDEQPVEENVDGAEAPPVEATDVQPPPKRKRKRKIKKQYFDVNFQDDDAVEQAVNAMRAQIIDLTQSERINVTIMGPYGKGKTALASTLFTCFTSVRTNTIYQFGQVSSSGKESTRKWRTEQIPGLQIYLSDSFGITGSNYTIEDYQNAIEGKFKDGFTDTSDNEEYRKYRSDNRNQEGSVERGVDINSRCHCIIYAVECGDHMGRDVMVRNEFEKLTKAVGFSANSDFIPIFTALTKVDKLLSFDDTNGTEENKNNPDDSDDSFDDYFEADLSEFYSDEFNPILYKEIRRCCKKVTQTAPNRIYPITNYVAQYFPDNRINYFALRLLRTAVVSSLQFKDRLRQRNTDFIQRRSDDTADF